MKSKTQMSPQLTVVMTLVVILTSEFVDTKKRLD